MFASPVQLVDPLGYWQSVIAYWLPIPGEAPPHGYSRCSMPPAAAYSHSASLGRKPPSQIQNAYASHQLMQSMGRCSFSPSDAVQVTGTQGARLVFQVFSASVPVAMFEFQSRASQPRSCSLGSPLFVSPSPP